MQCLIGGIERVYGHSMERAKAKRSDEVLGLMTAKLWRRKP